MTYDVVIGNREWLKRQGLIVESDVDRMMRKLEVTGQTVVLCAVDGQYVTFSHVSLSPVDKQSHSGRHNGFGYNVLYGMDPDISTDWL